MKIRSFAKINLGLEVLGKRKDGYHEIRTLFQAISLFDELEFLPAGSGGIILHGSDSTVPWDEGNLIFKAAHLLKSRFHVPHGVEIRVIKNIPAGRGLGGGSSNAAMTLYALSKAWHLRMDRAGLMALGRTLGADVPFFLEGGLCLGQERGDRIIPLADLPAWPCIIVLPTFPVSTPEVYARVQRFLTCRGDKSKMSRFLTRRELAALENELEDIVFSLYPVLKDIKSLIHSQGAEISSLSGTGSAVFGLFFNRDKAESSLERLKGRFPSILVETVCRERYWERIDAGV